MSDTARQPTASSRRQVWLLLLTILLVAAILRVWQIDRYGLWWDEGNNAYLARAGLSQVVEMSRITNDTNPPAHRLALGLWLDLLGDSVLHARLLSAVCGLGVVVLAYVWGRRLGGPTAGLLAAGLMALAPMAVYYDREAKGYPWVAFWAWLGLTLLDRGLWADPSDRPRWRTVALWAGYSVATALAVGAHYYGALFVAAQGLWFLGWLAVTRPGWRQAWRRDGPWLAALAGTGALLAPWVLLTWRTAFAGAQNVPMERGAWDVLAYLRTMGRALAAGPYAPRPWAWLALGALLLPAAWELYKGWDARRGLLAAVILIPLAIGFAAQAVTPFVIPRFFLYTVPALCVLAAAGLARLRLAAVPIALALLVAWGVSLPHAYRPVALPPDDLRPIGKTLAQAARPGDGVIVSYIWQEGMLRLYAPDAQVDYFLGWFTDEEVDDQMQALAEAHERLWLLTYQVPLQHPSNQGGWWLENHAARALEHENGHNRAVLYERPCHATGAERVATFAGSLHLSASTLPAEAAPGDTLAVTLAWEALADIDQRYAVFLQLLSPEGVLVTQSDGEPRNGLVPLDTLAAGESLVDCRSLWVPGDAAGDAYSVITGLYDRESGVRVALTDTNAAGTDHVLLGSVTISPRAASER